jgi:hypothetical protein
LPNGRIFIASKLSLAKTAWRTGSTLLRGYAGPRVRPTAQRAIKGDSHATGGAFKVEGAVARDDGTIVPGTHFVEARATIELIERNGVPGLVRPTLPAKLDIERRKMRVQLKAMREREYAAQLRVRLDARPVASCSG